MDNIKNNQYYGTNAIVQLLSRFKKGIDGEIAPISRSECDFGCGCYREIKRIYRILQQ